jgi:hypothetical protein
MSAYNLLKLVAESIFFLSPVVAADARAQFESAVADKVLGAKYSADLARLVGAVASSRSARDFVPLTDSNATGTDVADKRDALLLSAKQLGRGTDLFSGATKKLINALYRRAGHEALGLYTGPLEKAVSVLGGDPAAATAPARSIFAFVAAVMLGDGGLIAEAKKRVDATWYNVAASQSYDVVGQLLMSFQRIAAASVNQAGMLEELYEEAQGTLYEPTPENRALLEELRFNSDLRKKLTVALRPSEVAYTPGQLNLHSQMIDLFFASIFEYMAQLGKEKDSDGGNVFGA